MAVSGVRARLMLFEGSGDGGSSNVGGERKDRTMTAPPVQQKPDITPKWGRPTPTAKQPNGSPASGANTDNTPVVDTSNTSTAPDNGERKPSVGRVNVAGRFLNGAAPPPIKPVVPLKKPVANASAPSETEDKPKVALKPGQKGLPLIGMSGGPRPPLKPVNSSDSVPPSDPKFTTNVTPKAALVPTSSKVTGSTPVKLPALEGKLLAKTDNSPNSTNSSGHSSLHSSETSGPIDFRSQLRKTRGSIVEQAINNAELGKKEPSSIQSPTDTSPPPMPQRGKPDSVKRTTEDSKHAETIVERPADCKRFKKIDVSMLPSDARPAPKKPSLPEDGVDLSQLCQQHAKMLQGLGGGPTAEGDGSDDEDIYDDGSSLPAELTRPPPPEITGPPPMPPRETRRVSNRVSLIPDMTAEEEGFYNDGQSEIPQATEDLLYVDAASEAKPVTEEETDEMDEIYEDEDAFCEETEEERKKRLKEEERLEKKRKEDEEKRRKEEEKKKKQEEKKEQKRRKEFKLTGDEINVGEGTIKEDARGRNMLTVKQGQIVTIIRLDNNPANKWLVKTETDMGYVESSNIEIDPNIIRQAMQSHRSGSVSTNAGEEEDDDDQPVYDDVAASEGPARRGHVEEEVDGEMEDIYECVQ